MQEPAIGILERCNLKRLLMAKSIISLCANFNLHDVQVCRKVFLRTGRFLNLNHLIRPNSVATRRVKIRVDFDNSIYAGENRSLVNPNTAFQDVYFLNVRIFCRDGKKEGVGF